MPIVNMDGTPWRASQAGWVATKLEIATRVDRWKRERRAQRAAAPVGLGLVIVLAVGALEVGSVWAQVLSAVMLIASVVVVAGRGRR